MLIGIDARFYGEAGPGRYTKNIISHLEQLDTPHKFKIFLRRKNYELYQPAAPNFEKVLADYKWYSFEEQFFLLAQLVFSKLDLFYSPHFNIPILYPGTVVSAIPDIIMHTFSTEAGTTLPKPYYRFKKKVYYLVVLLALLRSKKVIVASNATLSDFLKSYKFIPAEKYAVCYEGVDPDFEKYKKELNLDGSYVPTVLTKFGIKGPFLLYVGSMYEHKNVKNLVASFKKLVDEYNYGGQLVLIGKNDFFSKKVQELVYNLGLSEKIVMPGQTGYVSDKELTALRKSAELYVFPSLKEGFSLTPLEAMASGLACVVSKIDCHEEVFGDACFYFDPLIVDDMASKISAVLKNSELKRELIEKGFTCCGRYSWSKTAAQTLAIFDNLLKR